MKLFAGTIMAVKDGVIDWASVGTIAKSKEEAEGILLSHCRNHYGEGYHSHTCSVVDITSLAQRINDESQ